MAARVTAIKGAENEGGWIIDVTVANGTQTTHTVRISRAEHERYGGGNIKGLILRSFEFLLERESNTSILREFDLSTIERYFPEYAAAIKRG